MFEVGDEIFANWPNIPNSWMRGRVLEVIGESYRIDLYQWKQQTVQNLDRLQGGTWWLGPDRLVLVLEQETI